MFGFRMCTFKLCRVFLINSYPQISLWMSLMHKTQQTVLSKLRIWRLLPLRSRFELRDVSLGCLARTVESFKIRKVASAQISEKDSLKYTPDTQCMVHLPTFTPKITQMYVNRSYIVSLGTCIVTEVVYDMQDISEMRIVWLRAFSNFRSSARCVAVRTQTLSHVWASVKSVTKQCIAKRRR